LVRELGNNEPFFARYSMMMGVTCLSLCISRISFPLYKMEVGVFVIRENQTLGVHCNVGLGR